MSDVAVRWAGDADLPGVAAVARATGSDGESAGDDPHYLEHVRRRGGLAVALVDDTVVAYGGRSRTRGGWLLTDLFVLAEHRGNGVGSLLLDLLWDRPDRRLTFASPTPPAAAVYARRGLDMLWPLLYLEGPAAAVPDPGLVVERVPADAAGAVDSRWQGLSPDATRGQVDDYLFWAGRPNAFAFVVRDGDDVVGAGAVGGSTATYGVAHLSCPDVEVATAPVLAAVRAAAPGQPGGSCLVCVPGPHGAVRPLLEAGFTLRYHDLFMATPGVDLDPRRHVLHPGLA